jgi:hypothetical protein
VQLFAAKRGSQFREELPAEQFGEHFAGEEESLTASYPARVIGRETARWDETVQMRMVQEFLTPRVKYREKAQFCTQSVRIAPQSEQCLGYTTEEQVVDELRVL